MKRKNRFKRGYCKLKSIVYNNPFDAEVIRETVETNILPPHEIVEIETNKYLVAVELYDRPDILGGGRNHSFYNNLRDKLEEIHHRKDISLRVPYDFLQFRKKGRKEWEPLEFSNTDTTGVLGFLPKRFRSQYPDIGWEKMKRTALEEAIEKAYGTAEEYMDDILNSA